MMKVRACVSVWCSYWLCCGYCHSPSVLPFKWRLQSEQVISVDSIHRQKKSHGQQLPDRSKGGYEVPLQSLSDGRKSKRSA